MTRDNIIRMAREAGLFTHKEVQPELERFATLVSSAEREACLEDLKNVFSTFDSLPDSPEVTLIRRFCSIFFEAFTVAINERIKP